MQPERKVEESPCSSQNFCLKVSRNSSISDIENTNDDDDDVIVISDSSSNATEYVSNYFSKPKSATDKYPVTSNKIYVVDSSDSDSMSSGDEKYFQTWTATKKPDFISNYQSRKYIERKNKLIYTSDESLSSSIELLKQQTTTSTKTSSNCMSCSTEDNATNTPEANIHSYRNTINEKNLSSDYTVSNSSNTSKTSNNNAQAVKPVSSVNRIQKDFKGYLSRKDARNIIKNIKSTRIVYESPKVQKKIVYSSSSNEMEDEIGHPAISPKSTPKASNIVVEETPLDSQNDIIPGSQVNLPNLYKTHVSKFLNTPQVAKDMGTLYNELSDRKKKQISEWLNENSPESQSDSSAGIVPASNRGDLSSGNSSLERLEMNYETPNNRGKIQQPESEKRITNVDCDKTPYFTVPRQTTITDFVQRTKSNTLEFRTPKKSHVNNNMFSTPANPVTNTPQNVNITDCAEILDKLYGKSWRSKADVLFPRSEPRKNVVHTKNRAVQTERRTKNKARLYISDSDSYDSETSMKDLKLQNSPTKKSVQKTNKQKDSFINDGTSSGSGCESLYYTALTNPGISTSKTKPKPTVPPIAQRLNTICDSDTECEDDKGNRNKMFDVRRKNLFNDDESDDDSDTSEFDPGDAVPPKPTTKKYLPKTPRQTPKLNARSNSNIDNRQCSFLASLSDNIPVANAHPDAKKYRLDYKKNKENLCNYLYKLYNEKVFNKELPEHMAIEWNIRMRGTAGYCYNKKSIKTLGRVIRSSRIVLATKILDTPDRLRDTLIHEMCHAATWLINGVSDGHGPLWTEWANKAMRAFPELPPIRRCHDYKIKTKFTYKCVSCGYSIGRHSKSLDIERKRCGLCYGKFELLINKTTKAGTVQVQTPKREVGGFALYVKENYNVVKKERNIKHAEVMKILGQQFSAIKIAKKQEAVENY